jgi:hypothetical protein
MTIRHRALASLGIAMGCTGLLLGLAGAERLLLHVLALLDARHSAAALLSLPEALGTLVLALVLAAAAVVCLRVATHQSSRDAGPAVAARDRHRPGSVTL